MNTEHIEDADAFVEELKVMPMKDALRRFRQAAWGPEHGRDNLTKLLTNAAFRAWCRANHSEIDTTSAELDQEEKEQS